MEKTKAKLKGKRILIWGYGREGKSTERLLKTECEPASVEVYEGPREGVVESKYDYIFVSPGIRYEEDAPEFNNTKFTSQTELFMEEYGTETIGITGTKGKSTTSSMLYNVLTACTDKKTFLMGNIGKPCFDYIAEMDEDSIAVFELSCHQCQRLQADPHIAVFLDLYEDHLDRYLTLEHYCDAKAGITKKQKAGDKLYVGENVPVLPTAANVSVIKKAEVGEYDLTLQGEHNQFNAEFVYRIAVNEFGCDGEKVKAAMAAFTGLPHRLEYAGTYNGIMYYDDSISTIPEAAINAAESVKNTATLLIGGMDRNIDYDILEDFIVKRPDINFILAYASGKRIYEKVSSCSNVYLVNDLEEQVALAGKITPEGCAVVMSNAAASYGYFKNFEERGDRFKELIKNNNK